MLYVHALTRNLYVFYPQDVFNYFLYRSSNCCPENIIILLCNGDSVFALNIK
jgi:hypothetical protein